MGKAQTCRSTDGLVAGRCGGLLRPLTVWAGGSSYRRRLYCTRCGKVASAKSGS